MTKFEGCYLTRMGLDMVYDRGISNITFTRAVTGAGSYTSKEDIPDMTALKEQHQEFRLDSFARGEDNAVNIKFKINNTGMTQGYQLSEIGVYAKCDEGEEKLYCVAFALVGNTDEVPADDGAVTYITSIDIETVVSTEAEISIVYSEERQYTQDYVASIVGELDVKKDGTIVEQIANIKQRIDLIGVATEQDILPELERLKNQTEHLTENQMGIGYEADEKMLVFFYGSVSGGVGSGGHTIPVASKTQVGGVKIGEGIDVDNEGTISVDTARAVRNAAASDTDVSDMLEEVFGS